MTYWLLKRVYSEKVGKGRQPYIWPPLKGFPIHILPTSRVGWKGLVQRIMNHFGSGRYRVMRTQFEGEKPRFRPVVYIEIRMDGRYRIVKRYTTEKAVEGKVQPWFKEHERRLMVTVDIREKLRARRRNLLKKLSHKVELQKPFVHEIRTSTGMWVFKTKR